ncbi:MAG TPA: trypsin-like peptidase domain-containing protein [Acetobacteraceae bacterium]|nr:trypsin-like peptidase domain-containing protein [Acetobacteraceae bacterium]
MRLSLWMLLAFAVALPLGTPAWARVMESSDAAIVRQASPAVVNISEWKVHTATQPNQSPRRVKVYASGFIIDPSGLIVTNKHVVDGAIETHVIFSNGERAPARLLAAAAMLDVAVIKVDVGHPLPALKWGNSDALQVGDPVLTIGNPLGIGMSVSAGIVSALNRNLHDTPFDNYIQTDAAINYGNSGGPLIDSNGDAVGIDTALYNPQATGGSIGIGFAIPSNIASFAVRFLLDPSHPKPGWIGVTVQDMNDRLADAMGVPRATGAIVSAVDRSGPASRASLRPADVLETIDGVQQSDSRAFMRSIVKLPVGTTVHLTGWREGKPLDTTVAVAAWPNYQPAQGVMQAQSAQMMIEKAPDPGMRLASITDQTRKQYGLDPALTGALVSAVEQDCEARELGIVPGDVIVNVQGQPVASPDDVQHAIQRAHQQRRSYLAMLIQGKDGLRWVSLSISSAGS